MPRKQRAERVNMSIEPDLLTRIDAAAETHAMSRSAYLRLAAIERLQREDLATKTAVTHAAIAGVELAGHELATQLERLNRVDEGDDRD